MSSFVPDPADYVGPSVSYVEVADVKVVQPADLGSIITNAKVRKIVWAFYGLVGVAIIGVMGGLTATGWLAPEWFIFLSGAYTAVGPAFASLAMANIK